MKQVFQRDDRKMTRFTHGNDMRLRKPLFCTGFECGSVVRRVQFHFRYPELQPSGNLLPHGQCLRRSGNRSHETVVSIQASGVHRAVEVACMLVGNRDQHATLTAEQEVGGAGSLSILAQGTLMRRYRQPASGIRDIGSPMLAAERAIACARNEISWIPSSRKLDAQRAAMAASVKRCHVLRSRHRLFHRLVVHRGTASAFE